MSKNTSLLKEGEDPLGLGEEVEWRRGRREEREGERREKERGGGGRKEYIPVS